MAGERGEKLRQEADASAERELARLEIKSINRYVIVRWYILKAMKLLGSLAFLWSTVVLLGGFVTLLKRIDFWLLTFIGFIQAAGLFNMFVDDFNSVSMMIRMQHSWRPSCNKSNLGARLLFLLKIALFVIFFLVPVSALLLLAIDGPAFCFAFSLARLLKGDYGSGDGDVSKANLTPALNLFYSLSAAQGALFLLCSFMAKIDRYIIVWPVIRQHGFSPEVVYGYFTEAKRECAKKSSIENWNLYTHATGLLDSELPEDYFSGARVLSMLIEREIPFKRLLIRSPKHRMEKLIRALNWISPADRETRGLAARIVVHLASDLNLSQFPGALECILSLLDVIGHSSQEDLRFASRDKYQEIVSALDLLFEPLLLKILKLAQKNGLMQDTKQQEVKPKSGKGTNEDLLLQGLRILENLAHVEHNCSVIYCTKGLLSKIIRPLNSDNLISSDGKINVAWIKVLDASLGVVGRLMEAPGDTGKNMRQKIAGTSKAVKNLEEILGLEGDSSNLEVQTKTIGILAQMLSGSEPAYESEEKRKSFINKLLHIFVTDKWMEDYFKDRRAKIDEQIMSQPMKDGEGISFWEEISQSEIKNNEKRRAALQKKMMNEAQETARKHKEMAGKALSVLSKGNQSSSEVIKDFQEWKNANVFTSKKRNANVIAYLAEMLGSETETIPCSISATEVTIQIKTKTEWRISAAEILKNFCAHTNVDDADKKVLIKKVLEEMLNGKTEQGTGARSSRNTSTATISGMEYLLPEEERMLQAALLSLYAQIRSTWTNVGVFEGILEDLTGEVVVGKLKALVEDNSYATPARLSILKIACELVKLFIQNTHYLHEIRKEKIIDALSDASETMLGLESCLLFSGLENDCHGVPVLPLSSVLIEEARELLAKAPESANPTPAGGPEPQNACRCIPSWMNCLCR